MSSKIHEVLNIAPHNIELQTESTEVAPVSLNTEDTDFDVARKNQYELLDQGKAAIHTAMMIAQETQNPRAIEVLAGLLKNVSEMNKQLLVLSKDKADIKAVKGGGSVAAQLPTNNIQNAVFVGNGADLNKLLADRLKVN